MKPRSTQIAKELPPTGVPLKARVLSVIDLGHQPGFMYQGKKVESSYKLEITYELTETLMEDGRPFVVSEEITNSDNEKSTLVAARAPVFGGTLDLKDWLGRPCMVTVSVTDKGWTKLKGANAVTAAPPDYPIAELTNTPYVFDLEVPDIDVFNSMPEFKQNKIKDNLDFPGSTLEMLLDENS